MEHPPAQIQENKRLKLDSIQPSGTVLATSQVREPWASWALDEPSR